LHDIDVVYVSRVMQEGDSSRRVLFLGILSVRGAMGMRTTKKVYQRLNSLPEQIQPIFGVEVSNHVTGHNRRVLAFSYSKLVSK